VISGGKGWRSAYRPGEGTLVLLAAISPGGEARTSGMCTPLSGVLFDKLYKNLRTQASSCATFSGRILRANLSEVRPTGNVTRSVSARRNALSVPTGYGDSAGRL
jgi:hypothetical protein